MRSLESRLQRLEHKFVDTSYAAIQIPFESSKDDEQYLLDRYRQEHGKLAALTVFITNYAPEFKEQFSIEKEKYRSAV